jgi:2-polyprenyl-6-methoxyphenol hydroxylase-like FAD-dependent oxidoreductase
MQGIIIGGGIGGLTTAVALNQRGMRFRLYESSPAFTVPNAGLFVTARAMRILDKMQLAAELYACGHPLQGLLVSDHTLKVLATHQCPGWVKDRGFALLAIHQADLQRIFMQRLDPEWLVFEQTCQQVREQERIVTAAFENGEQVEGDYLLAADGIRSRIRGQLFPESSVKNMPQVCWWGTLRGELPPEYRHQAVEAWGQGRHFNFVQTSAREIYWYALLNKHPGDVSSGEAQKEELLGQFQDFAPLIQKLIDQTSPQEVTRGRLADLRPLRAWYEGRVCLVGDAAHAMAPHLGQGVGQAIEDAWVMAALLDQYKHPTLAFSAFQQSRKRQVDRISRMAHRLGLWSQYENHLLVGLRNRRLIRMIRNGFQGIFRDTAVPE